jgi:UTP--glucose-1-phosphate uridylyltransferase
MLPLVDKPAIQYVVEEAIASGVDDLVIVTGRGKRSLEDHFDRNFELEAHLAKGKKERELKEMVALGELADKITYIRQSEARGLGHAIWCARKHIGDEPFAVLLGDDVVFSEKPCTKQLLDVYEKEGASVIAVEEIRPEQAPSYGVIQFSRHEGRVFPIDDLIEKPSPETAPSNLGILGRYVLTPAIFDALRRTAPGVGGEIQLTDAVRNLGKKERLLAYKFIGKRYDLGNKLEWFKTNLEVALMRSEYRDELLAFMRGLLGGDAPKEPRGFEKNFTASVAPRTKRR